MTDAMREEISLVMRGYVYETGIIKASDIDAIIDEIMQACAARMVPIHAEQIRVAAVAAIREVTGCPDIKGKDGAYLVDTLIVNLLEPAAQERQP